MEKKAKYGLKETYFFSSQTTLSEKFHLIVGKHFPFIIVTILFILRLYFVSVWLDFGWFLVIYDKLFLRGVFILDDNLEVIVN